MMTSLGDGQVGNHSKGLDLEERRMEERRPKTTMKKR